MTRFKILIVDDEKSIREIFTVLLEERGFLVEAAETGAEGVARARAFLPDIVLLDMNLPDMTGLETLTRIKANLPETDVVIITAFGTIRNAVEATKLGAYAYLEKPVDNDELLLTISRLTEVKRLAREVEGLRSELASRYRFSDIIGTSALLTTTMEGQRKLEAALKSKGLKGKIKTMVGGAPVTQRWADRIGADAYAEDATDGVRKAKQLLGMG